jgi:16S rRNA A1518/A1519 N6-dimethyltransferase RsmA/KsgA/DIM1 with predicted DNA glycosylase/AP lyase activity
MPLTETDTEFYPTPKDLAHRMVSKLSFRRGHAVLEPSAGKGDLIDALLHVFNCSVSFMDIDAVEVDPNLCTILKSKNIRVVHDDFLTFNTLKRYDVIIMNPPFSCGDKHLTKALSLLKPEGTCVCLLNALTLENLYSNFRKTLRQQLDEWGAVIENM